jgi:RNAse (barnase) inhibitor barstar
VAIQIDGKGICDWASFHDVFAELFGFPSWYGRNMDAWIDCMSTLDDAVAGLTKWCVQPGQIVTVQIDHATAFAARGAEQYRALVECTEFVNERRAVQGLPPLFALTFTDSG